LSNYDLTLEAKKTGGHDALGVLSGISHLQCAGCLLRDAAGSLVRLLSSILDAYANLWARVEPAKAPYEASDGRSGGLMASRRATSPLLSHDPFEF
jgi:hypothetical protein